MFDVAIIGAGICGASIAYELSRYQLKVCVLEKEPDVAMGTTKANSAIIHAGYDPEPGTGMAKYNVAGAKKIKQICQKLSVPYEQTGSLVVAFNEEDLNTIETLYQRGLQNGVSDLALLSASEVHKMEPALNPAIKGALLAKTAAVVSPWGLALAMLEVAVMNGCELLRSSEVTGMQYDAGYSIFINGGERVVRACYVINAAGLYADRVQQMAGEKEFEIIPDKGSYFLLDKSQGNIVKHVVFQCPTAAGKGVLVSPTVDGNLIVGPDSGRVCSVDKTGTCRENLAYVRNAAQKTTQQINYKENIRNFAGIRAYSDRNDFIVEPSISAPQFINVAGIKSPGLSSAPAIAEDVAEMLRQMGLALDAKKQLIDHREKIVFSKLSPEQKQALILSDPAYGNVICRCNTVTEGEILQALHSCIPAKTLDGVKRRCGSGMGRCQGGFCGPKIHEIIARETGLPMTEIELEKKGSYIVTEKMSARG